MSPGDKKEEAHVNADLCIHSFTEGVCVCVFIHASWW